MSASLAPRARAASRASVRRLRSSTSSRSCGSPGASGKDTGSNGRPVVIRLSRQRGLRPDRVSRAAISSPEASDTRRSTRERTSASVNSGTEKGRCDVSPVASASLSVRHDATMRTPSIGSTLMLRMRRCANDDVAVSRAASPAWSIASSTSETHASLRVRRAVSTDWASRRRNALSKPVTSASGNRMSHRPCPAMRLARWTSVLSGRCRPSAGSRQRPAPKPSKSTTGPSARNRSARPCIKTVLPIPPAA